MPPIFEYICVMYACIKTCGSLSHCKKWRVLSYIFIAALQQLTIAHSQSVIANGDFESYTECPFEISQMFLAAPWFGATLSTPDYFNACDTTNITSIPNNFQGTQPAHSESGYAGIYVAQTNSADYREFIEVRLTETLIPNFPYYFEMYVNLSDSSSCSPNLICAYLSSDSAVDYSTTAWLSMSSTFLHSLCTTSEYLINDKYNWQKILFTFKATGAEKFVIIGNNYTNLFSDCDPFGSIYNSTAYLFIDDVIIAPLQVQTIYFDTAMCPGSNIVLDVTRLIKEPENVFPEYLWSDGFEGSVRNFTSAGYYNVYINTGLVVDTINITINEIPGCPENFYVPNAFSPNNDGINDIFRIKSENVTVVGFDIYTRWGEKIFSSTDAFEGWDGTVQGALQNTGVYIYVINYSTNISRQSFIKKGTVTLVN
jgi:gliding motility-associated-like protein